MTKFMFGPLFEEMRSRARKVDRTLLYDGRWRTYGHRTPAGWDRVLELAKEGTVTRDLMDWEFRLLGFFRPFVCLRAPFLVSNAVRDALEGGLL